jgi:hypothetical protein
MIQDEACRGSAMDSGATSREPEVSPKKKYAKPELHIYGNIEKITLLGRVSGLAGDNGTGLRINLRTGA